jgi:predicted transcriptional regulator
VYKWLKRRRLKKAKIIYEFLKFTKENSSKIDLKCMKFYNIISKIQKRVKAFLARRTLRYAVLNGRWNQIEAKYYHQSVIGDNGEEGFHKNIVPFSIRRIYFREYLRFLRIQYILDFQKWDKD